MVFVSASFSNEVRLEKGVWNLWKDVNGRFEYYKYQGHMHKAVCIRRIDTGDALNIDLVVDANESKWYVRVRKAEWNPERQEVCMSKHTWHPAAALKALHLFVPKFGKWEMVTNNCFDFVKGLVGSMVNDERRQEVECEPILDFEEFIMFAEKLDFEVCYMKREEVLKLSDDDTPRAEGGHDSGVETDGEDQSNMAEYHAKEEQNNIEIPNITEEQDV